MREILASQAIREALQEEMERDPEVFIVGEDIGKQGGCNKVTQGLFDLFPGRVLDTPIAETAIAGLGLGAAYAGMKAVVEIMYADFTTVVYDYLFNQVSKARYMTGWQKGGTNASLVLRAPQGAGFRNSSQHSQSVEGAYMLIPGLKIAVPSTPYDYKGMLKYAIRGNDPVLFLEYKMDYFKNPGPVPDPGVDYVVPFGKAAVRREGTDITVVATQGCMRKSLEAAEIVAKEDISVEVVDPLTLKPLDMQTILKSVEKTGRLIVSNEGYMTGNALNEVICRVSEQAFDYLKAPPLRVCGPDTPIPFSPVLEDAWIVNAQKIADGIRKVMD
jgi:pyruvate dehydrogenase E1 component beta subunit